MVSKQNSVLITGATGLIGRQLYAKLLRQGVSVHFLSRSKTQIEGCKGFLWDVSAQKMDAKALEGVTSIIHLAGPGVGDHRWTKRYKETIYNSRIESTKLLVNTLKTIDHKVSSFISAGVVGYYDDCGSNWISEDAVMAEEFIARLCRDWEAEGQESRRNWNTLCGAPYWLSPEPQMGFLPKTTMTLPLRMLSYFGNGAHYYAWIHEKDVVDLFLHAVNEPAVQGIYNAVAPNPIASKGYAEGT